MGEEFVKQQVDSQKAPFVSHHVFHPPDQIERKKKDAVYNLEYALSECYVLEVSDSSSDSL